MQLLFMSVNQMQSLFILALSPIKQIMIAL